MYLSNGISWTQTFSADESSNNGARWDSMVWFLELSNFFACANGSNNDPVLVTSPNDTSWGGTGSGS